MKVLCLGNADNLGARVYSWLKSQHVDAELCRVLADEEQKRGDISLYLDENQKEGIFSFSKDLLSIRYIALWGSKLIDRINQEYDCVVITGGFHALLLSSMIKRPKVFMPVGYEVHYHAANFRTFPSLKTLWHNARGAVRNYFYSSLIRRALRKTSCIVDSFPTNIDICKSLGFGSKIRFLGFGEDVKHNRTQLNTSLLNQLNHDTQGAKKVFLWLSRLNYKDVDNANYKGPELFYEALSQYKDLIKSGEVIVYMGKHGVDAKTFMDYARTSDVFEYIRWVDHLDYKDLLAYLSINNAVLFSEFGEKNCCISGIARDAYTVGVPLVNQNTDEIMVQQYHEIGPRVYASNVGEVSDAMKHFITMPGDAYQTLRAQTKAYGEKNIDLTVYVSRLKKIIKSVTD